MARGGGAILNFASVNAYMALDGSAAVAGFIVTGATRRHLDNVPALVDQVLAKKMLKRVGQPEDIAWAATFLCSDEAAWVTASDFGIDGGGRAW